MHVSSLLKAVTWKHTSRDLNPRPFGLRYEIYYVLMGANYSVL